MKKPLHIPASKKFTGLKVHCAKCGTLVDEECKMTGKSIKQCPHPEKHKFKVIVSVPGSENARKTKTLETRDYNEAVEQAIAFQKEIKGNKETEPHHAPKEFRAASATQENREQGTLLINLMAHYVGYLHGDPEIVPEFKRKERGKEHVKDVERIFKYFLFSLKKNGYDVTTLSADGIDDRMLGKFHAYLLDDLQYGNRSYNKAMSLMTSFYTYLESEGYRLRNPFGAIARKPVKTEIETIEPEEYERLLEIVGKPELGMHTFSNGITKNLYKPWVKDAIELGLATGRRREEIVKMKWNNIIKDKNGNPIYIKIPDFKVNRQRGTTEEYLKYIHVPITAELRDILIRLGEDEHEGEDAYILAPEETMERDTMRRFVTRSFSHYYDKLDTGKHLTFGCLRKTYITHLREYLGDNTRLVTGHSSDQVMDKHYIDPTHIVKTAQGFSVFAKGKENRAKEIKTVREKKGREMPGKGFDRV